MRLPSTSDQPRRPIPTSASSSTTAGTRPANTEGPYDPNGGGVDRLVRTLQDAGIAPGANVYAELGSTWFNVMRDPDQAAHVLGKLLVAVGPDNVVWGTDSIWYGSPQTQIEAFRAFEITEEYQEQFGYPALTPELKRKILGVNGATLYGVDLLLRAATSRPKSSSRRAPRCRRGPRHTGREPRLPCAPTWPTTAGSASRAERPRRRYPAAQRGVAMRPGREAPESGSKPPEIWIARTCSAGA